MIGRIEPEKYFIVGDWDAYDMTLFRYQLDPGRCFICGTMAEAVRDVASNLAIGIPASIWTMAGRVGPRRMEQEAA